MFEDLGANQLADSPRRDGDHGDDRDDRDDRGRVGHHVSRRWFDTSPVLATVAGPSPSGIAGRVQRAWVGARVRHVAKLATAAALCGALAVAFGCGARETSPSVEDGAKGGADAVVEPAPAWGPPPPHHAGHVQDELARQISPNLRAALQSEDAAARHAAFWAIARIGGPAARDELVPLAVRGASTGELAAFALLERDLDDEDPTALRTWSDLEDALWARFSLAAEDGERDAVAFALGRVGGARVLPWLSGALASAATDTAEASRTSRAIGLLCARGLRLGNAERDVLVAALAGRDDVARGEAARALARCVRSSPEAFASDKVRAKITAALSDIVGVHADDRPTWELQHAAWRALTAVGDVPSTIPADVLGDQPPPPWVEAEAVRALVSTAEGRRQALARVLASSPDAFLGARANVLLELARGLRPHAMEDAVAGEIPRLATRVRDALRERRGEAVARERHALALIACELAVLEAAPTGALSSVEHCADDVATLPADTGRILAVEAAFWANPQTGRAPMVEALFAFANDDSPSVAAAAMSALAEVDDPRVNAVLRKALDHRDVGVRTAAAGSIAVRAVDANRRDVEVVTALERVVADQTTPDGLEARLAAIEALGVLARSAEVRVQAPAADVAADPVAAATVVASSAGARSAPWLERTLLPLAEDGAVAVRTAARSALRDREDLRIAFDAVARRAPLASFAGTAPPALLDPARTAAPRAVALRVETTAGTFTIDLTRAPSPIAQAHLVALARARFFDGLAWHRIVPGFVAQTGDPRGDGYGGPGYTMPCEWSNLVYGRGTVGIALAGRDTGGSQWFVTTSPQPHLDGRYTVVGHIAEGPGGMDVVDALLPADTILRVEVVDEGSAATTAIDPGLSSSVGGRDATPQDPA